MTGRRERVRAVRWRDLMGMTRWEKGVELTLSLPWLAGSWWFYGVGWWWGGVACSFFFFLTGLRQSHNAQHYAMGIGRRPQDLVLGALGVLMCNSMHAVQVTHLHHHRHCLDGQDVEAAHANAPWWRVLLGGPMFPVKLLAAALRLGKPNKRRWVVAELGVIVVMLAVVWGLPGVPDYLKWHTAAMLTGECFTGFFAVWTVHRGCDAEDHIARTQRGWLKNFVSYSMFYHLEHHLFPAVPTCHLPKLAARLDRAAPEVKRKEVF